MNQLDMEFVHHARNMTDGEVLDNISEAIRELTRYKEELSFLSRGTDNRTFIYLVQGHIGIYQAFIDKLQMVLSYRQLVQVNRDAEWLAAHG